MDTSIGYIYILLNPAMPGLFKIGKSIRSSECRAEELSNPTGIPFEFQVAYDVMVKDCNKAEKIIHQKLSSFRANKNREFFAIPLKQAIEIISDTIYEHGLDIEKQKVHPYKLNHQEYYSSQDLCFKILNSEVNWEQAKLHFEKGYLTDWLKRKGEYDAIINLEKAGSIDNSASFLLSIAVHSVSSKIVFSIFNEDINDYASLLKAFQMDGPVKKYVLSGEFLKLYQGYAFVNGKLDNLFTKNIDFISSLIDSDSSTAEDRIKKILDWFINPDYIYRSSINKYDIDYLITKSEYNEFCSRYVLPKEISEGIFSKEKKPHFEAVRKFLDIRSKLKKDNTYYIFSKFSGEVKKLSYAEYTHCINKLISEEQFIELNSTYIIPPTIERYFYSNNFVFFLYANEFCCFLSNNHWARIYDNQNQWGNLEQSYFNLIISEFSKIFEGYLTCLKNLLEEQYKDEQNIIQVAQQPSATQQDLTARKAAIIKERIDFLDLSNQKGLYKLNVSRRQTPYCKGVR